MSFGRKQPASQVHLTLTLKLINLNDIARACFQKRRSEVARRTVSQGRVGILAKRLAETAIDLQSLLADEADSVVCPGGESFLLLPAQASLRHSEEVQRQAAEMQRTILDAIPAHLAVLDRNGVIIFINESCQRFLGSPQGSCEYVKIGQNYIEYCELADHAFDGLGPTVAAGIRKVMQADAQLYSLTHPVHREKTRASGIV